MPSRVVMLEKTFHPLLWTISPHYSGFISHLKCTGRKYVSFSCLELSHLITVALLAISDCTFRKDVPSSPLNLSHLITVGLLVISSCNVRKGISSSLMKPYSSFKPFHLITVGFLSSQAVMLEKMFLSLLWNRLTSLLRVCLPSKARNVRDGFCLPSQEGSCPREGS